MTTYSSEETAVPAEVTGNSYRVRSTALFCVIGAVLQAILATIAVLHTTGGFPDVVHSPAAIAWHSSVTVAHALILLGAVSLAYSRASGKRRLRKIGLGIAMTGGAANLLATASPVIILNVISGRSHSAAQIYNALDGATMSLFALGITLVGVAVVRAGDWQGWHRITPLVAGIYLLVVPGIAFPVSPTAGKWSLAIWVIPAVLLGIALRAESMSTAR